MITHNKFFDTVKLPKTLKIAGYDYRIVHKNSDRICGDPANAIPNNQIIWVDARQAGDSQISGLIHEILEALNYHYQLKLNHPVISTLETALYQVLKDNNLLNVKEYKNG